MKPAAFLFDIVRAVAVACLVVVGACSESSSPSGGPDASTSPSASSSSSSSGASGSSTSSGAVPLAACSLGACATEDVDAYQKCTFDKCAEHFVAAYGDGYRSGNVTGPCAAFAMCRSKCSCEDTTCIGKCVPEGGCNGSLLGAISECEKVSCPPPACAKR